MARLPLLLVVMTLAVGVQEGGEGAPGGPPEEVELTILHTGAFLSAIEKAPVLARMVEEERKTGRPVLLVDTGNHMDPARLETTDSKGKINIDIMNRIGYHAMAIGVGELQYGQDREGREEIANRIGQSRFPLLSANLFSLGEDGQRSQLTLPCWPMLVAGLRIGIIGITSPEKGDSHAQRRIRERFRFEPEVDAVDQWVRNLRNKVDLIVVLSNGGVQIDSAILSRGLDVDIVVGVSALPLGKPLPIGNGRIVWGPEGGGNLGRIRLRVRRDPPTIVGFDYASIPIEGEEDPVLSEEVREMVGRSRGTWDDEIAEVVGDFGVSESADLVADAVREAGRAQIACCDTAEIIRPLPEGRITRRDLWALLPRRRHLVRFRAQGAEIRRFLEDNLGKGIRYRFSGVGYVYDPSRAEGDQLLSVLVGKEPLLDNREYRCAADGGTASGEGFFPEATEVTDTGESVRHALEEHIRSLKKPLRVSDDDRVRRGQAGEGVR